MSVCPPVWASSCPRLPGRVSMPASSSCLSMSMYHRHARTRAYGLWLCSVFVPVCPLSPVSISVPRVLLARFADPFLIFKLVTHRRIEVSPRDLIYTRCATAPLYTCIHVCVRASMSVPAYPQPLSRAPCLRGAPYSKTQGQQMENTLEIAIPKQKECLFFCLLNSILPL